MLAELAHAEPLVDLGRREAVADARERPDVAADLERAVVAMAAGAGGKEHAAPEAQLIEEVFEILSVQDASRLDAPDDAA